MGEAKQGPSSQACRQTGSNKKKRSDGLRVLSAVHSAQAGSQTSSCRPAVLFSAGVVLRCAMRTMNRAALLWSAREARPRWLEYGLGRPGMLLTSSSAWSRSCQIQI